MDLDKLLPALVAAKQNFQPIRKDSVNPFYRNKYASLASILDAVEPALLDQGLVICQSIQEKSLVTRLYHVSGQYIESVYCLPGIMEIQEAADIQASAQKLGSIVTYARRYALSALLGVVADEDNDCQSTSSQSKFNKPTPVKQIPTTKIKEAREAAGLTQSEVIELMQSELGVDHPKALNPEGLELLIGLIKARSHEPAATA